MILELHRDLVSFLDPDEATTEKMRGKTVVHAILSCLVALILGCVFAYLVLMIVGWIRKTLMRLMHIESNNAEVDNNVMDDAEEVLFFAFISALGFIIFLVIYQTMLDMGAVDIGGFRLLLLIWVTGFIIQLIYSAIVGFSGKRKNRFRQLSEMEIVDTWILVLIGLIILFWQSGRSEIAWLCGGLLFSHFFWVGLPGLKMGKGFLKSLLAIIKNKLNELLKLQDSYVLAVMVAVFSAVIFAGYADKPLCCVFAGIGCGIGISLWMIGGIRGFILMCADKRKRK